MRINYIITPNKVILFSFHRHHFNSKDGFFIDGGLNYTRSFGLEMNFTLLAAQILILPPGPKSGPSKI